DCGYWWGEGDLVLLNQMCEQLGGEEGGGKELGGREGCGGERETAGIGMKDGENREEEMCLG
ncbi:hypothetical protein, partial [Cytobacillus oceanisediminis]|uniref:hypothetical protein n=1 Tax=Cytobacillus oceanisediminis TaxID=665099 RepID=UPI00164321E4